MKPHDQGLIHDTALLEDGVRLGEGTRVWDNVHLRRNARIGKHCIIGEKTYVAYDVPIGDYCKLNACVYVCAGVTIEDFVMIAAHTVFTNDVFPRAGNVALTGLETSDPTSETMLTRVRRGVTIGANATIGPGVELGAFSMIGMASVVTKDVPAHALVIGNPARQVGWVCVCGHRILRELDAARPESNGEEACKHCKRVLRVAAGGATVVRDPHNAA
jgi:UDP-2-acetamido-3-amino-2,3-dideoxy-glucuronate N-acetyltransferase